MKNSCVRLSGRSICSDCSKPFNPAESPSGSTGNCDDCGGRATGTGKDDRPEAVVYRLQVYEEQTLPVVGYYQNAGLLVEVDGEGSPNDVKGRLVEAAVNVSGV